MVRQALRDALRHPWQTGLAVLGVALGVGVVVGILLANSAARAAFDASARSVGGDATHHVVGPPEGLAPDVYTRLVTADGVRRATPVIEAWGERTDGTYLRLVGIDPFTRGRLTPDAPSPGGELNAEQLIRPRAVLAGAGVETAEGGTVALRVAGRTAELAVVGRHPGSDTGEPVLVADLATVDALTGGDGRLTRIELRLDGGAAAELAGRLPDGARIVPANAASRSLQRMADAFHLNLTALALLSLLVGLFLIHQALAFLVVRRRPSLGTLRALGVTRERLAAATVLEGGVYGLLGSAAGLVLGAGLATRLVDHVVGTLTDLYFHRAVTASVEFDASLLAVGLVLGTGGAMLAALGPAVEVLRVPPRAAWSRSALERRRRRRAGTGVRVAFGLGAAGLGLLALAERALLPGLAAVFLLVLAATAALPWLVTRLLDGLAAATPARFGMTRLTARSAAASVSRTGVAVSALAVAFAAVVGMDAMIGSFRDSVSEWVERRTAADYYLDVPRSATIPPEVPARIGEWPTVDRVIASRRERLLTAEGAVDVHAVGEGAGVAERFEQLDGRPDAWRRFLAGDGVMVSEPLAHHRRLAPGDVWRLPGRAGPVEVTVLGIYRDYVSPVGIVLMPMRLWTSAFGTRAATGLAVHAASREVRAELGERLRRFAGRRPGLSVTDAAAIREASLATFDRTFAVTGVLRLLAVIVAVAGLVAGLMAYALESRREAAVTRAVGFTRGQLAGLVVGRGGLLGLLAGGLAVPFGIGLAWLLIHEVNRRAFGWTMPLSISLESLAVAVALALVAAVAASVGPARYLARMSPGQGLRIE